MSFEQDRQQLATLLTRFSVRRGGEYKLASGRISDVYCDARVTTCRAEAVPLIGRMFLAKMDEHGWRADAVGGLTMGADPIVIAVARESLDWGRPVNAFLVRKEAKGHGRGKLIEGLPDGESALDVVIVDDTCTTGDSTVRAVEAARGAGHRVLGALCLVDREEGARETLAAIDCVFDSIYRIKDL